MKVVNPDYKELTSVPIDIELRDKVGISLDLDKEELAKINASVEKLLYDNQFSKDAMAKMRDAYIYNVGNSGVVGAKYIIKRLVEKSESKNK